MTPEDRILQLKGELAELKAAFGKKLLTTNEYYDTVYAMNQAIRDYEYEIKNNLETEWNNTT